MPSPVARYNVIFTSSDGPHAVGLLNLSMSITLLGFKDKGATEQQLDQLYLPSMVKVATASTRRQ